MLMNINEPSSTLGTMGRTLLLVKALVPKIPDDGPLSKCTHGNEWNRNDPVENEWYVGDAVIYHEMFTIEVCHTEDVPCGIKMCYRPSVGQCSCKLFYDGQEDLLFNFNNKDVLHYSFLLSYLHMMIESRTPLASFHRAYSARHQMLSSSSLLPLHKLRLAWNAFVRLLDIDYQSTFSCLTCGDKPQVIICDGTSIGMSKDLLRSFPEPESQRSTQEDPTRRGTCHADRVFIPNVQARKLLHQYSSTGTKTEKALTRNEYALMITSLKKYQHLGSLVHFLQSINDDERPALVPTKFCSFLRDLAKNSPACALLQFNALSRVKHIIKEVIHGLPIFDAKHSSKLEVIQQDAPVVFDFLSQFCDERSQTCIPREARCLLKDILLRRRNSFQLPDQDIAAFPEYAETTEDPLACFPCWPKIKRKAVYSADKDRPRNSSDTCHKMSSRHPTLSPGIFTVYCAHGVCYGFQAMRQVESPEVPFTIMKTRFTLPPDIVIYDNACRLHQYCLNREPDFFKNTVFLVDRLHWKNHIGCCTGYNMDIYKSNKIIMATNSQVCEQGNAEIQRIKAQVSYMHPENFMFHVKLFLAISNMKKMT